MYIIFYLFIYLSKNYTPHAFYNPKQNGNIFQASASQQKSQFDFNFYDEMFCRK